MGSPIRLYLDENVSPTVAEQLRLRGIDVVTVRDLGLLGDTDENNVARASESNRVFCTYDQDILRIAASGVPHAGIVFARERDKSIGDWVRGLTIICAVLMAEDMNNHIEYL